jgi:putative ABC transport system permease protein
VDHRFGGAALGVGVGVTVLGSVLGALLTARRTARKPVAELGPPGKGRLVAAGFFLLAGLSCGIVTATAMRGKGMEAMQTAGQASIWFAIGLALLAPWLLRAVTAVLAGPLRLLGAAGELAVLNIRQQARQMSGAVMPVILFVGITTATVYMQAIDDEASAGLLRPDEEKNIQTLNYVVVGMIALFVAIMLVNTLLAATSYRRREFAQQRLAGSTPGQVLTMVVAESALLTVTGVFFGTVASVVTVLPFSIARMSDASPSLTPGAYVLVVTAATALTFAAAVGASRRAIAGPAVETVRA